jgi:glycosyltransferase involved in cell wall biosynthesis
MKKLKILITSPSLDTTKNIGGISNLTKLLIEKNEEVEYKHFVVGKTDQQKRNVKWFLSQFNRLYKFYRTIKRESIDVVHLNYPMSPLSVIINLFLSIIANKICRIDTIVHLRGGALSLDNKIPHYQKLIIVSCLKQASHIITLGEKEKHFIADFYNVNESCIFVLPNAVEVPDFDRIETRFQNSLNNSRAINMLFLGRIDKNKGLNEIIEALEILNADHNFIFHIAGTGEDINEFVLNCENILKKKFIYHGVLGYESKKEIFLKSDIFLLPSYFEGLPNALLEAMAYGLTPIVTPVGSIPELVIDNQNGLIVPIKNSKGIVEKIEYLFQNPHEIKRLGTNAYSTIKTDYLLETYIQKLNNIYYGNV